MPASQKLNDTPPPTAVTQLSLRSNFGWTFAGNVVNALCQFGVLAALARLGNPGIVGQFVLGLSIAAPVLALTMLQLRNVQVTDARGEYAFEDYFGTRIAWTVLGMAVIAAWTWLSGFETETAWVVILIGLAKCIESASEIVRGLFQRFERMNFSGTSLMLKGVGTLGGVSLLLWYTDSILAAAAAMVVVAACQLAAYDALKARRLLNQASRQGGAVQRFRPRFDREAVLGLTWTALPLGIVMCLVSLQVNIPRYVLQSYDGKEALGYFGALVYPMVAGTMVTGALGQAASPKLARHYLNDFAAYGALLRKLLLVAAGLGVALVVGTAILGRFALDLLYGGDYAVYHREFFVLAIAAAIQLMASSLGYGLTAGRFFRTQVVLVTISCSVATAAALILVPTRGVMGAALTVLATSIVMFLAFAVAIGRAFRLRTRSLEREANAGP